MIPGLLPLCRTLLRFPFLATFSLSYIPSHPLLDHSRSFVHLTILRTLFSLPGLRSPFPPFICLRISVFHNSLSPTLSTFPSVATFRVHYKSIPLCYGTGPLFLPCTPLYPYLTCERFALHVIVINFQNNIKENCWKVYLSGKQTQGREDREGPGFQRAFRPSGEMSARKYAIRVQFISILTGHTVDVMEWNKRSTRCITSEGCCKKGVSKMSALIMKDMGTYNREEWVAPILNQRFVS